MLVNSGGKFQPLKIIPIVIPTRIYTAAGTVRLEHVYIALTKAGGAIGHMYDRAVIHMTDRDVRA